MRNLSFPSDSLLEMRGYRLTTIEILYELPDHPALLQTFVWQTLDLSPDFPRMRAFLGFWHEHIEARLFSVKVAQRGTSSRSSLHYAKEEFSLH